MINKRDNLIDFLRLIAIILMIYAHSNMILNVSGDINNFFEDLGNFICFVLFLFCYGASSYIQFRNGNKSISKYLKRIVLLYVTYFIVSFVMWLDSGNLNLFELLKYLIFWKLPAYGEFLVAFILFEVIYLIFNKQLNKLGTNILLLLITTSITFFIGNFLKEINFGILSPYTSLIWGQNNFISFPLMQYLLFFLLGIFYAETFALRDTKIKKVELLISIIITAVLFLFSLIFYNEPSRWPPNATFRLGNALLLFSFVMVYLFIHNPIEKNAVLMKFITAINKFAIHILYFHLIFLFTLKWLNIMEFVLLPIISILIIMSTFFLLDKVKSTNAIGNWPQIK